MVAVQGALFDQNAGMDGNGRERMRCGGRGPCGRSRRLWEDIPIIIGGGEVGVAPSLRDGRR